MTGANQIEKKERGFIAHLLTWFAWAFVASAIYVLSIGPVMKLVWKPGAMRTARVGMRLKFYAPLSWVCENNRAASDCLVWYLQQIWGIR
jgi:hypothetical protein